MAHPKGEQFDPTEVTEDTYEKLQQEFPNLRYEKEEEGGESREYITSAFDIGQREPRSEIKKADVPVARIESSAGQIVVKIENGYESHAITLKDFPAEKLLELSRQCAELVQKNDGPDIRAQLPTIAQNLMSDLKSTYDIEAELQSGSIPEYSPYAAEAEVNEDNLKSIDWLIQEYAHEQHEDVDQTGERLLTVEIGGEEFEILESGQMYFLMENTPTIKIMDAAIREGIMTDADKEGFISLEEETLKLEKTKAQYLEMGEQTGEQKDYRKDDYWATAEADYGYDAERRLHYLEIGGEPVMDEFEKDYIELLGANASRYDSVVVEVGFGMGLSANAIMEELGKQKEDGKSPSYVVIEYNHDVAEKAREWGKRQDIPVVVLEGDWQEEIKKIPNETITGALIDPYPLSPEEKHEDAARPLQEIYKRLRPGGVASYYPDSEYCLSDRHAELAREAGFDYIGTLTARFAKEGKKTNEYYLMSRMALPALYKGGGTGSSERVPVDLGADEKRELIRKLFVDNPKQAREQLHDRKFWKSDNKAEAE